MNGRLPYPIVALSLLLATGAPVRAEPAASPAADTDSETQQLRAYGADLQKELDQVRAALAASEQERAKTQVLLDSTTKQLREELARHQASYAQETVRHEKEVRTARGQLDATKAEEEKQAARAAELEKNVAELHRSIESQESERKKLEAEVASLEQAKQEAAKTEAAALADRDRQLKELGERLTQSERERQSRTEELDRQQKRLAEARAELGGLQAEREQTGAKIKGLDSEISSLRSAASEQIEGKRKLERQLADLTKARSAQAKTDAAAIVERNAKIAELTRRVAESEREGSERREKLEHQTAELEETRRQLTESSTASRQSEETLASRARDVESLRTDLASTQREDAARLQDVEAQARELEAARSQLQALQRDTADRQRKADALQQQIADLRATARKQQATQRTKDQQSRDQIAELSTRSEKLEAELASYRAAHEASAGDAKRVARERSTLADQLAGLSERGDKAALADRQVLKKRLGDLQQEGRAIDASQRDQQQRIDGLEAELKEVKETSRSRLETLESVLKSTRSAGAGLRAQLDEVRSRNGDLSKQVAGLKESVGKVHGLQTNLQKTKLRLEELAKGDADSPEILKLRAQQSSLEADLVVARSTQESTSATLHALVEKASSSESPAAIAGDDAENGDVREQLALERERRQTLESELQRLTASGNNEEKYAELWKTLQSARSEILILTNQLADERRSREDFELQLSKLKEQSGADPKSSREFAQRLSDTLKERRAEADRLSDELKNANEAIVRLKGRLEASGSPLAESKVLADLDKENQSLRDSLKAAEAANRKLQAKADMAERLAEMVYGKSQ